MSKNCAIVVAAGKGTRMNTDINKQFINLKGNPILYYTLKKFQDNTSIDNIVLVLSKDEIGYCVENVLKKYHLDKVTHIVEGGKTRQESVISGLNAVKDSEIVLIHDGARPFIEDRIIEDGIKYAKLYGASACGVKVKDTIKVIAEDGFSKDTLKREELFSVQTPQCFKYDLILNCHKKALKDNIEVTDDTSVVESYGHRVYLYEGSYNNIKITTPEDLPMGESILENIKTC
ncbi:MULTISPECIES: 2-C-methyl-D-erythritol 4-phosphate cytidylyltransferase [Clostridium]|uniref:2-C-methyl-D-erythritol 4-phosphate cytidylyltransferase n=1 Tax=Clostridium novyi (strain NT) TaxID=386415 RepID=ISPD_CLONN|nr:MULTISPECIES: 2-C-methyl-D-erythritol 4-phosphate cytidylyltransferase [Clostridium]A0PXS4.1 RecName: Full=2-C-methyl-D-erythritol 4-phosphate cytidylyltransferase; AltName: Full=4-diphosphocytidyl-2C-methyl-D-erythritol synthase; AltName: Full=MEP cytidylyltransferase; Short=MCT [Clostridium novyi NT]ABK60992.1 2-C-methyl-D-erythritol 4-phosphate cytidylyltransferase [Clostridium novyi NT]KEH85373.1 2-C-methyl-D-erythritol 4-phosphate cytidylyltransferase [Clostridium novyi A str. NCTC 538]